MSALAFERAKEGEPRRRTGPPLLHQIGNTPLLPLDFIADEVPDGVRLSAKAEWLNPTGSVKDRPAASILRAAFAAGELDPQRPLLDSTSGNMGIAYATFGAALGVEIHLAVPENASQARLDLLRALGAHLTPTDPLEGSDGARRVAAEMARAEPGRFYYADQYSNPANWGAHYRTTGPELLRDSRGQLTHLVAGLGTSGTIVGTGRFLREQLPQLQIVALQPDGPLHGLEGLKHYPSSPVPEIYDRDLIDRTIRVSTERAYVETRRLAQSAGMLVGVSAGAALAAGLELAQELVSGHIVIIFPDTGTRYLNEPFWEVDQ